MAQHTGGRITVDFIDMHGFFEITDGHLFDSTTDHASSNYWMTCELQSTLQASGIEWAALRHCIPCMAHVI
jgi:hypothetical protein